MPIMRVTDDLITTEEYQRGKKYDQPQVVVVDDRGRIDELSYEELSNLVGMPKEYPLFKKPVTDRDPVRNAKAYAVGKFLAKRKKKIKHTTRKHLKTGKPIKKTTRKQTKKRK